MPPIPRELPERSPPTPVLQPLEPSSDPAPPIDWLKETLREDALPTDIPLEILCPRFSDAVAVLSDSSDLANGYVIPFPFNRSVLYLSPPVTDSATSLFDYNDWWTLLIMHEYTHVVHLDKGHGFVAGLRNVFGRVPLFFPNALNTRWVLEGLATHYETDDEAGTGRGQSSYFKMLMRAELASGFKPVSQVNLPISSWPGGHTPYLYGVYFFRFLDSEYGEGASERFVQNYSDNFIPWRIAGILKKRRQWRLSEFRQEPPSSNAFRSADRPSDRGS